MASDKQQYNKARYIDQLKKGKEAYKVRKEYVANFKLPNSEGSDKGVSPSDIKKESGATGSAVSAPATSSPNDAKGILALGKTKMGAPYVFGAAGPNTFDCSGFVTWVFNQCGYKFERGTAASFYEQFEPVSNPQAGDLVFFSGTYKAGVSHIGIVMGDGNMLHTANEKNGVEISSLSLSYWQKHFTGYRRVQASYYHGSSNSSSSNASTKAFMLADSADEILGDGASYPPAGQEGTNKITSPTFQYIPVRRKGDFLLQNNMSRESFLVGRVGWARNTQYENFVALDKDQFVHHDKFDGYEGNLYSPDAKTIFENLLLKTEKPYFEVISGFRFSEEGQLSPHEAGCAIDILVKSIDEAREIADCAWQLGVRSIAIGGDLENKKGFLHIDIAPKEKDWSYDGIPIYGGPGKWVIE